MSPMTAMETRRCGNSELKLSVLTLGLMVRDCRPGAPFESVRQTVLRAFERGVFSIDLATGYGGGAVESAVGAVLKSDLAGHREALVLATKAGWGDGSRRTLTASLEQSLRQLGVDHVDLYYHHAPDADTPMEETAAAMDLLVRQGKTRYVGISNYSLEQTVRMAGAMRALGTPCVAHQANYNLLNRWVEDGLIEALGGLGMSLAAFSVVNQGVLADSSVTGPRPGSRAEKSLSALPAGVASGERAYGRYPAGADVRQHVLGMLRELQAIARDRGQTLSQLALAWVLRHRQVATALVGMSSIEQVEANVAATQRLSFSAEELDRIAAIIPPRWGMP